MELMIFMTVLCFGLSLFRAPFTAAASLQIQLQQSHDPETAYNEVQFSLPRKLRVLSAELTVKGLAAHEKMSSHNNPKEDVPAGNTNRHYSKEQGVMQVQGGGSKATWKWQEWAEGGDTSQYFTMDYSHVKRRRPIHNKSLPAAP